MRGLIYKELILSKKNFLVMGGMALGFLAIEVMLFLSTYYGNLAKMDDVEDQRVVFFMLFLLVMSVIFFGIFGDNGVTESDFKTKWYMFGYTLPVSEYKLAAVKIGKIFLGTVAGLILSLLNLVLLCGLSGEKMSKAYVYYMLAVGFGFLLINCITMPMIYRFRKEKTAFLVLTVLYAVVMSAVMVLMKNFTESFPAKHPEIPEEQMDDAVSEAMLNILKSFIAHWGWTIPMLIAAVTAAGYLFTVRAMKRRGV